MKMLGEQTLTRKKQAAGTRINGVWQPGNVSTSTFRGVIQPMTDREVQQLPEGWRTRARWKLYTADKLQTADVSRPISGDRVVFDGKDQLVVSMRDYMQTPATMRLRHYKYALVEPERTEHLT